MTPLSRLHATIDARVIAIREAHPDWPCGKGCDTCCKRLADLPRLTAAEWALLKEGLSALGEATLREIRTALEGLARTAEPPLACPLLDPTSGECRVYAHRPVACRSYGFYVQRDKGLHCDALAARVEGGTLPDVVWGNHDGVERELASLGEVRTLAAWFLAE